MIDVTNDYSSIKNDFQNFVTQYNKLRQFYAQQTKGALGGDPVLREVLNDVKQVLLMPNPSGGRYQYLAEIGLELTATGDLKLDESKFDAAMDSFPDDVKQMVQGGNTTGGLFAQMKTALNNLDGDAGLIKSTRDNIQTTLSQYADRIERQQEMLDVKRQALMKEYAAADEAMSRLNQLTASLQNLQKGLNS